METRNEKWQSLRLEAQKFVPQEYCWVCWEGNLYCQGGTQTSDKPHYIFVDGVYFGDICETSNTHSPHNLTVYVRNEGTEPTPSEIESAITDRFTEADMVNASGTKGSGSNMKIKDGVTYPDLLEGWTWNAEGQLHFAEDPTTWTRAGLHS